MMWIGNSHETHLWRHNNKALPKKTIEKKPQIHPRSWIYLAQENILYTCHRGVLPCRKKYLHPLNVFSSLKLHRPTYNPQEKECLEVEEETLPECNVPGEQSLLWQKFKVLNTAKNLLRWEHWLSCHITDHRDKGGSAIAFLTPATVWAPGAHQKHLYLNSSVWKTKGNERWTGLCPGILPLGKQANFPQ